MTSFENKIRDIMIMKGYPKYADNIIELVNSFLLSFYDPVKEGHEELVVSVDTRGDEVAVRVGPMPEVVEVRAYVADVDRVIVEFSGEKHVEYELPGPKPEIRFEYSGRLLAIVGSGIEYPGYFVERYVLVLEVGDVVEFRYDPKTNAYAVNLLQH